MADVRAHEIEQAARNLARASVVTIVRDAMQSLRDLLIARSLQDVRIRGVVAAGRREDNTVAAAENLDFIRDALIDALAEDQFSAELDKLLVCARAADGG